MRRTLPATAMLSVLLATVLSATPALAADPPSWRSAQQILDAADDRRLVDEPAPEPRQRGAAQQHRRAVAAHRQCWTMLATLPSPVWVIRAVCGVKVSKPPDWLMLAWLVEPVWTMLARLP